MAYYRIERSGLHTGYAIESTENTLATMTSANFIGDHEASLITPKYDTVEIKVGGRTGTEKIVTGKVYGEMSNFTTPVSTNNETGFFRSVGGIVSGSSYYFGGSVYGTVTGANKGRISTTSLSFTQYDGKEQFNLAGARPTSLKIGAKDGEVVKATGAFQGFFTKAVSAPTYFQAPTTNKTNILLGGSLSISGVAYEYTEVELDFKPSVKAVESASNASGYSQFEVIDIDPTITVSLYPGDPATTDLWSMMASNPSVPFSWSFGSGAGNTYTVTATVQQTQQEGVYNNGIQQRKLVLKPVYDSTKIYELAVTVS